MTGSALTTWICAYNTATGGRRDLLFVGVVQGMGERKKIEWMLDQSCTPHLLNLTWDEPLGDLVEYSYPRSPYSQT